MPKDFWTQSYTRGYYYGRSGREDIDPLDLCYHSHAAFKEGLKDGSEDFRNIDLVTQSQDATSGHS